MTHEDSLYADETQAQALADLTGDEQRGRWRALCDLDKVLAAGVNPATKRAFGDSRRVALEEERADILRVYEGTYEEFANAFGSDAADELRRRVEGEGGEQTQPSAASPAPPLDFTPSAAFGRAFRRTLACDPQEPAPADRGDWLGRFAGRQCVLRITSRPLAVANGHYLDARVVAGGGGFSGAELSQMARVISEADAARRPCRVRLAKERYRSGRVRGAAQGLVSAHAPVCALTAEDLATRAGRKREAARLAGEHGDGAAQALEGRLDLLVAERYYAVAAGRGVALDEELSRLDARIDACLALLALLGKSAPRDGAAGPGDRLGRYVRGRRQRADRRAEGEWQPSLFAVAA